jgi:hypothetical protein
MPSDNEPFQTEVGIHAPESNAKRLSLAGPNLNFHFFGTAEQARAVGQPEPESDEQAPSARLTFDE